MGPTCKSASQLYKSYMAPMLLSVRSNFKHPSAGVESSEPTFQPNILASKISSSHPPFPAMILFGKSTAKDVANAAMVTLHRK